jgi:hypothetical protein
MAAQPTPPPEAAHAGAEPAPVRRRRRFIPAPLRHALIASCGVLLAVAVSYALRKIGY